MPRIRGVRITGSVEMFCDQCGVLVNRTSAEWFRSQRRPAGATRSDPSSVVPHRRPHESAGAGRRTRDEVGSPPGRSSSAAINSSSTGSILSAVSTSMLKRDPMTAAAFSVCFAALCEPVDTCCDRGLQRGRHADVGDIFRHHVGAAATDDDPAVDQVTHDLLDEKGVACGAFDDPVGESGNRRMSSSCSATRAAVCKSSSGARAMVWPPRAWLSVPWYSGR